MHLYVRAREPGQPTSQNSEAYWIAAISPKECKHRRFAIPTYAPLDDQIIHYSADQSNQGVQIDQKMFQVDPYPLIQTIDLGLNGLELEQPLGIGKLVKELYTFLINHSEVNDYSVAKFLLKYPEFRGIIRRIQTLSNYNLGEVNDNILAMHTMPINMLRFKLSFFGASRYDPKSDRWIRVSFFPGAPFFKDLNKNNVDQWGFATMDSYS